MKATKEKNNEISEVLMLINQNGEIKTTILLIKKNRIITIKFIS